MDITLPASFLRHDDPATLADLGITDDERRTVARLAGRSNRDAEPDGRPASPSLGARRALRGLLATSVLVTVRPSQSPKVNRLGLVPRTEVLRNG
jgi:hypothetical protein